MISSADGKDYQNLHCCDRRECVTGHHHGKLGQFGGFGGCSTGIVVWCGVTTTGRALARMPHRVVLHKFVEAILG